MKTTSKFCIALVIMSFLFSVMSAAAINWSLEAVRQEDNNAIAAVVAIVHEKYPDVKDEEIAELLNGADFVGEAKKVLERYGIEYDDAYVLSNRKNYLNITMIGAGMCVAFGIGAIAFFWLFVRFKTKQEKQLTQYLCDVNSGIYKLPFQNLTEDRHSVLTSEIYKTTVMLREKQAQSAQEKAVLKDSLSDISHQLKTPLTSMLIMIDNIIEDDMPEELRNEFLCDIRNSVNHISFLTQSLLTLSKLDADAIAFHHENVSLRMIFVHCFATVNAIAQKKGVTLVQECEDISLDCDEKWISEALTNIVKNCVEHTPKGGTVSMKAEDTALYTKIIIQDTGCGIDKQDLPHIFERFYRGKNADENSVGIGLAMSKSIIEKCGGYIKVSSELDKGSTFTIKFFKLC